MANYATLKAAIQQVVKTNGNNEITGALLQQSLLAMINSLGADYMFVGIANENTNPGTPDQNVFYLAGSGTYPNFNSAIVPNGYVGAFKYNGSWTIETVPVGKDYDQQISEIMQILNLALTLTETTSPNLFDKSAAVTGKYVNKATGAFTSTSNWVRTDYIDISAVDVGATLRVVMDYDYSGSIGVAYFDANKVYTHGGAKVSQKQSGDVYFVASIRVGYEDSSMVVVGNNPGQYYPYGTIYTVEIDGSKLADGSVDGSKLAPGVIGDALVDSTEKHLSFNMIDFDNLVGGTYINATGGVSTVSNTQYRATGFIPLNGNKVFYGIGMTSYGSVTNGAAVYNANKEFIRAFRPGSSGSYDPATDSGAAYIRLTLGGAYTLYYVVYADADGNNPMTPGTGLTTAMVNFFKEQEIKRSTPDIVFDKSVLPELLPAYSLAGYDGFRKSIASVAAGANVSLGVDEYPAYIKTVHTIAFKAQSIGAMGTDDYVRIGLGYNTLASKAAKITPTQIVLQRYDSGTGYVQNIAFDHGLTISDFLICELSFGWNGGAVRLVSRTGAFSQQFQYSQYAYSGNAQETYGRAFVDTTVALTGVTLAQDSDRFRKPIWFIGDSYTSMSAARWTYQMVNTFGIDNFLVAGYAGAPSESMEPQLEIMLRFGTPKYLVWCMGMNDQAPIWLNWAKQVEMLCRERGITLIYQTIPKNNDNKNEINLYIQNSGYRYIDFVAAVMRNGVWYPDMDDDGTHPTQLGAKVLAGQILVDFPEILQQ